MGYKLIEEFKDAFVASTSTEDTIASAFYAPTASEDEFIGELSMRVSASGGVTEGGQA